MWCLPNYNTFPDEPRGIVVSKQLIAREHQGGNFNRDR